MLYSWIIKHENNWKINTYGEARTNIKLHGKKYYTISLLHVLMIQILCYQPIPSYIKHSDIDWNPYEINVQNKCKCMYGISHQYN